MAAQYRTSVGRSSQCSRYLGTGHIQAQPSTSAKTLFRINTCKCNNSVRVAYIPGSKSWHSQAVRHRSATSGVASLAWEDEVTLKLGENQCELSAETSKDKKSPIRRWRLNYSSLILPIDYSRLRVHQVLKYKALLSLSIDITREQCIIQVHTDRTGTTSLYGNTYNCSAVAINVITNFCEMQGAIAYT